MRTNQWLTEILVIFITVISMLMPGAIRADSTTDTAVHLSAIINEMSLEEKIGQMFMPDFRQWNSKDVTEINDEIVQAIQKHHIGGVILFRENLVNTGQTVRLVDQLQRVAGPVPLLISTDQEGGVVNRLQSGTVMPGNMALGATRSTESSRRIGQAIGAELHALGININFAPVLDVNVNPDNPVIGVRSFGSDPHLVSDLGVAYIQGLHDSGIAATAKHFPGHGDTAVDSHLGLPSVPYDLSRLNKVELIPFQKAISSGVDLLMTAHVTFPAIDSSTVISRLDNKSIFVPATLSEKVLTGLIRNKLGFKGVVVTDSLQMKAITEHFGPEDAVIRAVKAGTDIILMPSNLNRSFEAMLGAVRNGEIPEVRINESVERILALKFKLGLIELNNGKLQPGDDVSKSLEEKISSAQAVVRSSQHQALEQEVAGQAVTLLKNEGNILPFKLSNGKRVVFLAPWQDRVNLMKQSLLQITREQSLEIDIRGFSFTDMQALNDEQKAAIADADYVVLGSSSNDVNSRTPGKSWVPDFVLNATNYCRELQKAFAVIAIRNPYDIMYIEEVPAYICIYGRAEGPDIPAGIKAVFGELNPSGKLPVAISKTDGGELYPLGYGLSFGSTMVDLSFLRDQNNSETHNRYVTRADFVAILIKVLGLELGKGENKFKDVQSTDWYGVYTETASAYSIISGYSDGNFGPNKKITREEAITMIARAIQISRLKVTLSDNEITSLLAGYTDSADVSEYAKISVGVCLKAGVLSGRSNCTIAPRDYITKEEVIALVQRVMQKL